MTHRPFHRFAAPCLLAALGVAAAGAPPPKAGVSIFGPGHGRIHGLVVDPAAAKTLYAASGDVLLRVEVVK